MKTDWNPVSIAPTDSGDYLVCYKFCYAGRFIGLTTKILTYSTANKYWQEEHTCDKTELEITHWHKLPELPKMERQK